MDKLATIEKIHSIQTHPNEEVNALQVAKIKEWPVVVKKDQFKEGELVVFIRIDSICPKENPYFIFLERQKYRIWNAKFKGAPSQGLVCPLSILPPRKMDDEGYLLNPGWDAIEGYDVTEVLKITKYEKPLDLSIRGDAKGGFPTHLISITDEDNLLNTPETLKELDGKEIYITTKVDGSSATIIYENGNIHICSRRLELKEGTGLWNIFEKYNLSNKLKSLNKNIAIQSECCGGKIQGNPLGLLEPTIFVFNVKEIDTGKWYGKDDIFNICNFLNIPMVKIIDTFIWNNSINTIIELQNIANSITYKTYKGEIKKGEGIVIRPAIPFYSEILGKMWSAKILNQDYK